MSNLNKLSTITLLGSILFLSACMDEGTSEASTELKPEANASAQSSVGANNVNTKSIAQQPELAKVKELSLQNDQDKTTQVTLKGKIVFNDMEGGFYGFIAEDGNKYTPMQLEKTYLRDGLIVELKGLLLPNMMTITQYGTVLKVESAVILDDSEAKAANPTPSRPDDL